MEIGNLDALYSDGDVDTNRSGNPRLGDMIESRLSRRGAIMGGAKATGVAVFSTSMLAACGEDTIVPGVSGFTVNTSTGLMASIPVPANATNVTLTQASGPALAFLASEGMPGNFIAPAVAQTTTAQVNARFTLNGQEETQEVRVQIAPATLGFTTVAKNFADRVTVPAGYSVKVMTALGDPIKGGVPAFKNDGTDTDYANRIGDHGDALYYYGLAANGTPDPSSSTRGLLVQNHENLNVQYLHVNGPTSVNGVRPESEAIKEIEAHGVSITEYVDQGGRNWTFLPNGNFNRRITPNTPMQINGPVAGSDFVKTKFSNAGTTGRGTINNCANGDTAWNTLLTCEENWAGYFRRRGDEANRTAKELRGLTRYGVSSSSGNYGWSSVQATTLDQEIFSKWDARATSADPADALNDYRNEPNQYGWVVEIDPYSPTSTPRKRTALGRMGHEGAWMGRVASGNRVAFYMGDDARNEYFYKFVSAAAWNPSDANSANRLAIGDKYLDNGDLFVAVFNADGTGSWRRLAFGDVPDLPDYSFANQADILVHTRLAADAVGATTMDRPEWTATNPVTGEIYLTLTNNREQNRPPANVNAANPRYYQDPTATSAGGSGNPNGHIIRIREGGDNPAATTFTWDIYLFGADSQDPVVAGIDRNVSGLTAENDFSSPDGLWFARSQNAGGQVKPLAWIQTDDGAFTDRTNNQMLAALPGTVGDGGSRTIQGRSSTGVTTSQLTQVGAAPTTAVLKRFLTGPIECEITGVDSTPDGRTLFVGIQHPGEDGTPAAPSSNWPQSQSGTASGRPRSAVVAITKNDGGIVGF